MYVFLAFVINSIIRSYSTTLSTAWRDMQRFLRDMDNNVLEDMMFGISGAARKHIFENLPSRLAVMIAADMDYISNMGNPSENQISSATQDALNHLAHLMKISEIGGLFPSDKGYISEIYEREREGITDEDRLFRFDICYRDIPDSIH